MRLSSILMVSTALLLSACATPYGPQTDFPAVYETLGSNGMVYWIDGGSNPLSAALANALLPADAPVVVGLARQIEGAASGPVKVAVVGNRSPYTARVTVLALQSIKGDLPQLSLLFIGDSADQGRVRAAVEAKKATFYYAAPPS
jgi:uncharacterized lipoprotein YmbA